MGDLIDEVIKSDSLEQTIPMKRTRVDLREEYNTESGKVESYQHVIYMKNRVRVRYESPHPQETNDVEHVHEHDPETGYRLTKKPHSLPELSEIVTTAEEIDRKEIVEKST